APEHVAAAQYEALDAESFTVPQYRAVMHAVAAAGGVSAAGRDWVSRVAEEAGEALAPVVSRLAVTPLLNEKASELPRYAASMLGRLQDLSLTRRIGEVRGRMQRAGEGTLG